MNVISLSGICKKFKKVTLRKNYGTIKSYFLGGLTGGRTSLEDKEQTFEALRDITLAIPKGSTWGLIGKNGSGKSTLLKLIAGIYSPDSGSVEVNGKVSALIELGAGFHPDFSGRENIFINASILGFSRREIENRFDEIVAFAELEGFIDNPVRTYSSGMFMRLGFSIAVHVDPDILLVDEVLAVGDEAFSNKCYDKMESFRNAGKTIVLVSHSLGDIEKWCDGVAWLEDGIVQENGKPVRVIDAYLANVAETENVAMLEDKSMVAGGNGNAESNRWGDLTVGISKVVLRDDTGEERYVFQTGQSVLVEINYKAKERVEEPVFGIGIFKHDGTHCYGSNTDIEDIEIESIEGDGSISICFNGLNLVDGSYRISVAVHAKDGHSYDYHDQMYEFSVRSKIKDVGVFRPAHTWTLNGETPNIAGRVS